MARKKRTKTRSNERTSKPIEEHSASAIEDYRDGPETTSGPSKPAGPSKQVGPTRAARLLIGVVIVFHFAALFISYSAIIEPSSTHARLLDWLAPYLRTTHFAADGRRFYLAHATPDEQPHRLQVASAGQDGKLTIDSETSWTTIEPSGPSGLAGNDHYSRWVVLAATLSESDRHSLAASMVMPIVRKDESIGAVRIVRLPTQLTTAEQDAAGPVYLARVLRDGDQVQLLAMESKRLTTSARVIGESAR